jgi:hypothetical protein
MSLPSYPTIIEDLADSWGQLIPCGLLRHHMIKTSNGGWF